MSDTGGSKLVSREGLSDGVNVGANPPALNLDSLSYPIMVWTPSHTPYVWYRK